MTVQQTLTSETFKLTNKEQQVVRALTANYPTAGLATVASLAERAGVSVPTVLRLVTKLGFGAYADFQAALIEEVADQLNSPLSQMPRHDDGREPESVYQETMMFLSDTLRKTSAQYNAPTFENVLNLLGNERSTIHCLGGRFSSVVALRLAMHLGQIRPGVVYINPDNMALNDQIVDFNTNTTLAVFDYRRYQDEVIDFARRAHAARARIVLFTDRWMSPIAEIAHEVLVSPVESPSAFDSWIPALAQTEAIVSALIKRSPDKVRERLAVIEALRTPVEK